MVDGLMFRTYILLRGWGRLGDGILLVVFIVFCVGFTGLDDQAIRRCRGVPMHVVVVMQQTDHVDDDVTTLWTIHKSLRAPYLCDAGRQIILFYRWTNQREATVVAGAVPLEACMTPKDDAVS